MAEQEITLEPTPAVETLPTERPVQNVVGEFNRKFGQISQQVGQLAQAVNGLIEQRQAPAPAPAAGSTNYAQMSDDDLWARAQAGEKGAFDVHQERKAARVYQQMRGVENHDQLVNGQLAIIGQKYPVLGDPAHPLTQTANNAYTLLTQRGYPASKATQLEAIKTAIADRPDLVAAMQTQGARAREGARRVSADNPGVIGATHRQEEPAPGTKMRVTPEQQRLAQRMNVKDPAKAMERFLKRRETGESNFGAVGAQLQDGQL